MKEVSLTVAVMHFSYLQAISCHFYLCMCGIGLNVCCVACFLYVGVHLCVCFCVCVTFYVTQHFN